MYKKAIPENYGMFFIWNLNKVQCMWMKNTYIPLDVIFLNKDMEVLGFVKNTIPLSHSLISINKFSNNVLEINNGKYIRIF